MMVGDVVFSVGEEVRRFPQLTVRQLATMQSVMAARAAQEAAEDCARIGLAPTEIAARCAAVREEARLSTAVVRWCFTLDGALRIISESVGADAVDAATDGIPPDDLTEIALQIVGFHWDATTGKWGRRLRVQSASAPAIG
jgi:hypothetical protein